MASYYKPKPPFGTGPIVRPPLVPPVVPPRDPGVPPKPVPPLPGENPPDPVIPPGGDIPPIIITPVDPNPKPPVEPVPPALQPGNWSNAGILIHHGSGGRYFVYKRVGSSIQQFVFSFSEINQDFLNNIVHSIRFGAPIITHEPTNDKLSD